MNNVQFVFLNPAVTVKHAFLLNILSLNQSRGVSEAIVTQLLFLPKPDFTNATSLNCQAPRSSKYEPCRGGTRCPVSKGADTQQP